MARWARGKGYKMPRDLDAQLIKWKFQRALLSENQIKEVMADFWFNHFTVSLKDPQARGFIMSYDRDAILPHALGSFRTMLGATAKHPAMLLYLDNAQSTASKDTDTTMMANLDKLASKDGVTGRVGNNWRKRAERRMKNENRPKGVNENYARELLELHTLGVDGGYDQQDVEEVARAFTGWTLYPMGPRGEKMRQRLQKRHRAGVAVGFERQGSFLFRSDAHDAEAKLILGKRFPSGGGVEEGERVLDMLTAHTSTARFVATKMARRFVMDHPPETLINPMAAAFYDSGGDIKTVIRAMVQSPEFWSAEARKGKVKTPFELMISSLRILDAKVPSVRPSLKWIERLGQPIYRAPGPDGFPDIANRWINSGTLLQRIELAKKLAEGELGGVRFSVQDIRPSGDMGMVHMWASQLLPGRDVTNTVALIKQAPELKEKDGSYANELVIGLILGSPEFQRK